MFSRYLESLINPDTGRREAGGKIPLTDFLPLAVSRGQVARAYTRI